MPAIDPDDGCGYLENPYRPGDFKAFTADGRTTLEGMALSDILPKIYSHAFKEFRDLITEQREKPLPQLIDELFDLYDQTNRNIHQSGDFVTVWMQLQAVDALVKGIRRGLVGEDEKYFMGYVSDRRRYIVGILNDEGGFDLKQKG